MPQTYYLGARYDFQRTVSAALALLAASLVASAWSWGLWSLLPALALLLGLSVGLWQRREWARRGLIALLLVALAGAVAGLWLQVPLAQWPAAAVGSAGLLLGIGAPCLLVIRWLRSPSLRQAFGG